MIKNTIRTVALACEIACIRSLTELSKEFDYCERDPLPGCCVSLSTTQSRSLPFKRWIKIDVLHTKFSTKFDIQFQKYYGKIGKWYMEQSQAGIQKFLLKWFLSTSIFTAMCLDL